MNLTKTPELAPMSILIVDDEPNIRKTLAICLEAEQHKVVAVSCATDALEMAIQVKCDLAFVDIRLGQESGLLLLPELLERAPWMKIIMITAHATIDSVVEAMKKGAFDYLPKPFTSSQIFATVHKVAEIRRLENQLRELQDQIKYGPSPIEISSHSVAMQRAVNLAKEVASSDATVLITGESGTGKGAMAKVIHAWSRRAAAPFGVVSCPSLSPELLESELFGHTKGAFTGAIRQNPGRIIGCERGTLFLDEIGDLPLNLQPKLLRFLQDREYEAVGDTTTRRADVRIIAATNLKLKEAVAAKRFREDLYYRLNVIQIEMPPLRERREDIPLLAHRFLGEFSKGKSVVGFTESSLQSLQTYSWPGNVRELRNVIERAAIICHEEYIQPRHLTLMTDNLATQVKIDEFMSLEELEESHIRKVLACTRSMEEASRILGIDSVTLWRRRKKYGL